MKARFVTGLFNGILALKLKVKKANHLYSIHNGLIALNKAIKAAYPQHIYLYA